MAYLFYEIFKPAGAGLSMVMALFRLVFSAAMALVAVFHFLPFVLLSPAIANLLFPFILLPAFVGEISLTLWLLAFGVGGERWRALRAEAER